MADCLVTVDSLLEHCKLERAALRSRVTDKHLEIISRVVLLGGLWRKLAPHLEVDRMVVDNIEHDYQKEEMKKYAFLCKWSELKKAEATYERLVESLLMLDASAAGKVCEVFKNEVNIQLNKLALFGSVGGAG